MTSSPSTLPLLKKRFPFRLAVPSYILPDAILPNVRFLGPCVDEIELVLFESVHQDNLPSRSEVQTLYALGTDLDITYNVHLPIDVYLAQTDEVRRRKDVATIFRFYEGMAGLSPTCYVLHLEPSPHEEGTKPQQWLEQAEASLQELVNMGMNPAHVTLENIDHPLDVLAPMALSRGFRLCQDVGHLIMHQHDLATHLATHIPHTRMIHLHGIHKGKDHKNIGNLPASVWETIKIGLAGYTRGLSLEVFSLQELLLSCPRIMELCHAR